MNTFEQYCLALAAVAVMAAPVSAQTGERRATLGGGDGNGSGKCTIEVYMDGPAEVESRGDRGILRTTSGQPAQWRRFVCSGPLPADPPDFGFNGVDGRGRQELVQDPRSGHGAALVRIQDADGGAEGYTFDLVWRGVGFASNPAGRPMGTRDRGPSLHDSVHACQEAVRERANQQYSVGDIDFRNPNAGDDPGRSDAIVGFIEVSRGDHREMYRFSCRVDQANGSVRGAEIFPEHAEATDRYSQGRAEGPTDRYAGGNDSSIIKCSMVPRSSF